MFDTVISTQSHLKYLRTYLLLCVSSKLDITMHQLLRLKNKRARIDFIAR